MTDTPSAQADTESTNDPAPEPEVDKSNPFWRYIQGAKKPMSSKAQADWEENAHHGTPG